MNEENISIDLKIIFDNTTNLFYVVKIIADCDDFRVKIISHSDTKEDALIGAIAKIYSKYDKLSEKIESLLQIIRNENFHELTDICKHEVNIDCDEGTIKFYELIYDKNKHDYLPLIYKNLKNKE